MELLVEAAFTPEEAIRIASANGAESSGSRAHCNTFDKHAATIIIHGNPASDIADVRHIELVFKDGVRYDSVKLISRWGDLVGEQ